jgi:hypothetical protein
MQRLLSRQASTYKMMQCLFVEASIDLQRIGRSARAQRGPTNYTNFVEASIDLQSDAAPFVEASIDLQNDAAPFCRGKHRPTK